MRDNVLLCALDELDDAGNDGDDEPDGAEDLEERPEAAHPDRSLADLLADLARICGHRAVSYLHCSSKGCVVPWRVFSLASASAAISSAAK